jgi:hypothetical protein
MTKMEVIEYLVSAEEDELLEVVGRALGQRPKEPVECGLEHRFVLCEAFRCVGPWTERLPKQERDWWFQAVAWPARPLEWGESPPSPSVTEFGTCETCGAEVRAWTKRAPCPLCGGEVFLT